MTLAQPKGAPGAGLPRVGEPSEASQRRPHVLLVGFEAATLDELLPLIEARFHTLVADDETAALRLLDQHEVAVLGLGPRLSPQRTRHLLSEARRRRPAPGCAQIVVTAGSEGAELEELAGDEQLFYFFSGALLLGAADLAALVASGAEQSAAEQEAAGALLEPDDRKLLQDLTRFLAAQPQVEAAEERIAGAVASLLRAQRAFCLACVGLDGSRRHPTAGLTGFVARTGLSLLLDRAARDPRYVAEVDGSRIGRDERLLMVSVRGADSRSLALLLAVRSPASPAFTSADRGALELLADQVSFYFRGLDLPSSTSGPDGAGVAAQGRQQLYRREALTHYASGRRAQGDVIRVAPRWAAWTYWLLLAVLVVGLLYGLFGTIREYASGPAVIRFDEGRTVLTATAPGTVSSISARVGERVRAGQLLATLYGAEEAAALKRIEQKIELELIQRLRNPADDSVGQALIDLRAEQELARTNLEERSVRAPSDGTVGDVRVRSGQYLSPGDVIMTLHGGGFDPSVLALLPGRFRPLLKPGMPLRLELEGYRHQPQDLVIDGVGEEVIGPAEAARYLGSEISDAIRLDGPLVLVRARLESRGFEVDGQRFEYHDGMQGVAEVPVRSERILSVFFPGLKALLGSNDG